MPATTQTRTRAPPVARQAAAPIPATQAATSRGNQAHLRKLERWHADPAEHEADRIAGPPSQVAASDLANTLQAGLATAGWGTSQLITGGEKLPATTRRHFESALGTSLAGVRLHQGPAASAANAALGTRAFTYGKHIWFGDQAAVTDRTLIGHELTHVLQQAHSGQPRVQARLHDEEDLSIVRIIAFANSVDGAQVQLSDDAGTLEPITLTQNTLPPGTYTFEKNPDAYGGYSRTDHLEVPGGIFWVPHSVFARHYVSAPTVTVVIMPGTLTSLDEEFRSLPPYIQAYITFGHGQRQSIEALRGAVDLGEQLLAAGVSEDELLRLEYTEGAPDKRPLAERVSRYLLMRSVDAESARDTRNTLVQAGNRLATLAQLGYPLPPLQSHLLPQARAILDRDLQLYTAFGGVGDLDTTIDRFANALDDELYNLGMAVLNGVDAGLIKMESRFIGHFPDQRLPPVYLMAELKRARADPNVADAVATLEDEQAAPNSHDNDKQLKSDVDQAVAGATRLKLKGGVAAELLEAKSGEDAQNQLIDFINRGRATVQRARSAMKRSEPRSFYWDKLVAAEKQRLGVQPGSTLDWVINQIVSVTQSATTFWEEVWSVFKVVVLFVPGPLGFALRTVAAVVDTSDAVADYRRNLDAFSTGLSSQQPALSALYAQVLITGGGVAVDAAFTRFVPAATAPVKFGGATIRTVGSDAAKVVTKSGGEAADVVAGQEAKTIDTVAGDTAATPTPADTATTTAADTTTKLPDTAPVADDTASLVDDTATTATHEPPVQQPAAPAQPVASTLSTAISDTERAQLESTLNNLKAERQRLLEKFADKQRLVEAKRVERDALVEKITKKINFKAAKNDPAVRELEQTLQKRTVAMENVQANIQKVEADIAATNRALNRGATPWRSVRLTSNAEVGIHRELEASTKMQAKGWTPIGNTIRPNEIRLPEDFRAAVAEYHGSQGIDGIYERPGTGGKTEYVIAESKGSLDRLGTPSGTGLLNETDKDGYQMSRKWIRDRLGRAGLTAAQRQDIELALSEGRVKLVYAQTDKTGTRLFSITQNGDTGATIGDPFD